MNLWNRFSIVLSLLLVLSFLAIPVSSQKHRKTPKGKILKNLCGKNLLQGVKGKILFSKGNQMPGPDRPSTAPTSIGVSREIGIFELCHLNQTTAGKEAGFYRHIQTKKVGKGFSNSEGCFSFALPPGKYSFFTKEKGGWYANSFGGNGEIFEVEVLKDQVTEIEFMVNYAASY